MTADPKPDAVTADQLREMARLCRPCACDYGCRHDVARGKIHDLGGWHTIAMKLLDEADELRTELAEARGSAQSAHAVCFAAGIEAAAKYHDNFLMTKTSVAVEKVVASTEAIRALTPPDITAAAARVLIPVFEEKHRDYMLSKGRNPDDYSSHFSMAVIDLRALAEVKP